MTDNDKEGIQTGSTEFKTVKAGCGIRFDPETLDNESGFDFSSAESLKTDIDEIQEQEDDLNNEKPNKKV